jgi:hypothetical protein
MSAWAKVIDGEPISHFDIERIISVLREPGLRPHNMSQEQFIGLQQKILKFVNEWQQALNQNNQQQQ